MRSGRSTAPLTPTQRDLYLHWLRHASGGTGAVGISVDVGEPLDPARWRRAVEAVVRADEVASSRLVVDGAVPRLERIDGAPGELRVATARDAASAAGLVDSTLDEPFDLSAPGLVRNLLVERADGGATVGVVAPHLLLDGFGLRAFLQRVADAYLAPDGAQPRQRRGAGSFFDHAARDWSGLDAPERVSAWRARLVNAATAADLGPPARTTPPVRAAETAVLDAVLVEAIRARCRALGTNVGAFLLAAFAITLGRLIHAERDVVVLAVVAGRPREHLRTLGCFYQVLPYVLSAERLDGATTLRALGEHIGDYRAGLGADAEVSMQALEAALPPGALRCYFNHSPFAMVDLLGESRVAAIHDRYPPGELHLVSVDAGAEIRLACHGEPGAPVVPRFLERLVAVCARLATQEGALEAVDLLLPGEREILVRRPAVAPGDTCRSVVARIAEQFTARAEAVAVCSPDGPGPGGRLTYAELDAESSRLVGHLASRGVRPGDRVAVLAERGPRLVSAIVAVARAGAACVPLEPEHPDARLCALLDDAAPRAVLADRAHAARVAGGGRVLVDLDEAAATPAPTCPPQHAPAPTDIAYVIYTSGSTGTPKGVEVTHRNLARLLDQQRAELAFVADDVWTLFHSVAFDFSVWELWGALVHGARLVVVPRALARSTPRFLGLLRDEAVTVLNQTPTAFLALDAEDARAPSASAALALRLVILGGEALNPAALRGWIARHGDRRPQLVNMYGITETTVHVTYRPLAARDVDGGGSPIGRPLPDLTTYLLDRGGRPVPPGVVGEIHVGGAGVAAGYLGQPDLTRERFPPDPFVPRDPALPAPPRMYRSGDLARWVRAPDGGLELEFLGRRDDQLALGGYRVEPGEVEAALLGHPDVGQAAVVARQAETPGAAPRLVAYVVASPGRTAPESSALRAHLGARVPAHMVPVTCIVLDALPRTANGKLDRAALPDAAAPRPHLDRAPVAPRTDRERELVGLFESVLGLRSVGVEDDFFALGGTSLAAMQLAARARAECALDLSLVSVFDCPTVAGLARLASAAHAVPPGSKGAPPADVLPADADPALRPLTFAQERVWFVLELEPTNRAYEFLSVLRLQGRLDVDALEASLAAIVRRHEIYRTTFETAPSGPMQRVHPPWRPALPVTDLRALEPTARETAVEAATRSIRADAFALDRLPLVRWRLLRLADDDHRLLHFEHHLLHDGWSFVLFLRELLDGYEAGPAAMTPAPPQPGALAARQRAWLQSEGARAQLAYWRERLRGAPPVLDLPSDRPRPAISAHRGRAQRVDLGGEATTRLRDFAAANGVTPHMVLLAAFATLLGRHADAEEVVIGAGVAGRHWAGAEQVMGMLINSVALRVDLAGAPDTRALLGRIRDTTVAAYRHQDVPFEAVVRAVNPPRSASTHPIFQVMLTSYDGDMPALSRPGLEVTVEEGLSTGTAKLDLNLVAITRARANGRPSLELIFEHDVELFDDVRARRMLEHLQRLLSAMMAEPERSIWQLPMVTETERRRMSVEWNATARPYPRDSGICDVLARRVAEAPHAVAVVAGDRRLTYAELDHAAARLAGRLAAAGVEPGDNVGVALERGPELVVALVAVLRAGAAYVPLDPTYPPARLRRMAADADIRSAVVTAATAARIGAIGVVCLSPDDGSAGESSAAPSVALGRGADPAYVMFTSGSTGRPKGVRVTHRGVLRLVLGVDYVRLDADSVVAQLAPSAFDASTFEIWGALLNGGTLAMAPPGELSLSEIARFLATTGVNTLWLTAGLFHQMIDHEPDALAAVRQVVAGGEALSPSHVRRALARLPAGARLVNGYGPTECTTFACCHVMDRDSAVGSTVPIGRPIANTRAHVLDRHGEPAPIGVAGELCLAGDGLALGYLGAPDLDAARFVPVDLPGEPDGRVYRTGDRARWSEDGTLEFLGRADRQLKIRGFRVEPAEVEAALREHPRVADALVTTWEVGLDDHRLVAYLVDAGEAMGGDDVVGLVATLLPAHLIPTEWVWLPSWPLTPEGKIDRAALPGRDVQGRLGDAAPAASTATEASLAAMWCELLARPLVGIDEDFFALGGHSLLATRLMNRIRAEHGVELPLRDLFDAPTVRTLGARVDAARAAAAATAAARAHREVGTL
ncbi:MAG: amino acid adenylation domain-containing protein [Ectothiorhodospiraceae bacterium]|nr:amino acid adenylation domain-containing protein [Ectothiorhodospiraceae bacterium]